MTQLNKKKTGHIRKVSVPLLENLERIVCPHCGNSEHFVEQLDDVTVTTVYRQNADGSFSAVEQSSEAEGELTFCCAECGMDLTPYHARFRDMAF